MAAKLNVCGQLTRIAFVILNIFFLVIGLVLIGVGSYLVSTNNDLSFFTGSQYVGGAALLIIAGIVVALITFPGILGAIFLWKFLLVLYAVVIAVIIILEIVAGIVGFAYRNQITGTAETQALSAIKDYRREGEEDFKPDVNSAIDYIQNNFDCCGWVEPSDWIGTAFWNDSSLMLFPDSCECTDTDVGSGSGADFSGSDCQREDNNQIIYRQGCESGVNDFFRKNLAAIGGVGIAFGILQILSFLFAVGVLIAMRQANEYTTV